MDTIANQYKVVIKQGDPISSQVVEVTKRAGDKNLPVHISAKQGVKYELQEFGEKNGKAPDQIKVKRVGKNLHISFEDTCTADVIIDGYYDVMPEGYNGVIGQADNGAYYEYAPGYYENQLEESVQTKDRQLPWLQDGGDVVSIVVGGAEVERESETAALTLGLTPVLVGLPLLIGGGAATAGVVIRENMQHAPPKNYIDDVGSLQNPSNTELSTDDATPGIRIGTIPVGSSPKLYVDGLLVAATYDPSMGTLTPTTPLVEGVHFITYSLTDVNGYESTQSLGMTLTVVVSALSNATVGLGISISTDTNDDGMVSLSEIGSDTTITSHVSFATATAAIPGDSIVVSATNNGEVLAIVTHLLTTADIKNGFDVMFAEPAFGNVQVVSATYVDVAGNAASDTAPMDSATLERSLIVSMDVAGTGGCAILLPTNGYEQIDLVSNACISNVYGIGNTIDIDQIGMSGDQTLTSTGAQTILGGQGNDTLIANGADVLYGEAGNDVFVVGSSTITALQSAYGAGGNFNQLARINGGDGIDTLRVTEGASFDFTMISNPTSDNNADGCSRVGSIEKIDLSTDLVSNTVTLRIDDVIDMSESNLFNNGNDWIGLDATVQKHQIVINGTPVDSVNLSTYGNVSWTNDGTVTNGGHNYAIYNATGANMVQVLIEQAAHVSQSEL